MARKKRTDPHRPGAIIPAEYTHMFAFSLPSSEGGFPVPGYRLNCVTDNWHDEFDDKGKFVKRVYGEHGTGACCVKHCLELGMPVVKTGGAGKCSVCGAYFVHGDLWRYEPTGELLFLGHDCARKYDMLADRSAYELEMGRRRAATAREAERALRDEFEKKYCEEHPGLGAAFEVEHHIIADLRRKLREYRGLSDAQIALALRLAAEANEPAKAPEVNVPAPTGKVTFVGTIVKCKSYDGAYGSTMKMTVKVTTPEGVWLAWGTMPASLMDDHGAFRGAEVEVTATLKAGRDKHFAIMGRPRGKTIKRACDAGCRQCSDELAAKEETKATGSITPLKELAKS